jgi:hypothetical protein
LVYGKLILIGHFLLVREEPPLSLSVAIKAIEVMMLNQTVLKQESL